MLAGRTIHPSRGPVVKRARREAVLSDSDVDSAADGV